MPPKRKHGALASRWTSAKAAAKRRRLTNMAVPYPRATGLIGNSNVVRQGVDLGKGPIPTRTFVWMKYVESQTSGAADRDRVYNLNSISDPDETGGGHRPIGYTQYGTFYNRYRVWAVRAKVTFAPKPSVTSSQFLVGIASNNSIVQLSDMNTAQEQSQYINMRMVSPQGDPVVVKKTFLIRNIVGASVEQYKDDRFQAIFGSNPTERMGLHVLFSTALGGTAGDTVLDYRIELEYRVELFDPLPLAGSVIP